MNTNCIAALACVAALALGACSGGTPATTETTETTTTTPGTTDPAAPDDRTDAQKAFDRALTNAGTALTNARMLVNRAIDAANEAETDAARLEAQGLIGQARTALGNALEAAQALEALVPTGDNARSGGADRFERKAENERNEDLRKLSTAEARTGWSGSDLLARAVVTAVDVTRTERIKDGEDVADRLKAADLPAVMYETDKAVLSANLGSSGDQLRMRGIPVRWTTDDDDPDNPAVEPGQQSRLRHPNNDLVAAGSTFDILAGLTISPSGLVIDLGGGGSRPGSDLRTSFGASGRITGSTSNAYDLNLDFGRPSASPTGNAEYYWAASLMPTDAQAAASNTNFKDGTRTLPTGTYYVRLSNHLGLDKNLENPNDPVESARDDDNSYMTYAAYGLFDFLPRFNGANDQIPTDDGSLAGRMFPFHVGYDAFKDATDMRVTDIADADRITSGKFKGRTIAQELIGLEPDENTGLNLLKPPAVDTNALLLRGDVELTATLSGTAGSNKISGKISNLESWDTRNGYWRGYSRITGDVTLSEGDISDYGSFTGVVADPDGATAVFAAGAYRGSFYGPLSGLEAAGAWLVNYDYRVAEADQRAIVGSFGTALVREDGTYGRVERVGSSGN